MTSEKKKTVNAWIEAGAGIEDIAERMHLTIAEVQAAAGRSAPHLPPTDVVKDRIRAAFLAGESTSTLESRYGYDRKKIESILGSLPLDVKNSSVFQLSNPHLIDKSASGLGWEEATSRWRAFLNQPGASRITPPKPQPGTHRKILNLTDFHIPFHNEALIEEAMRRHADADLVVISGDLMDFYAASRFAKYTAEMSLREEFQAGKIILEEICRRFPQVILFSGNHDVRAYKKIASLLDNDLRACIKVYGLLELLKVDCPNVTSPEYEIDGHVLHHLWHSGDLVIGHPETAGGGVGVLAGITRWIPWLINWRRKLGMGLPSVVAQGHTHSAGEGYFDAGIKGMELGCLCKIQGYSLEASSRYRRPQINGYATFEQHLVEGDWVTDRNEARFWEFES